MLDLVHLVFFIALGCTVRFGLIMFSMMKQVQEGSHRSFGLLF